MITRLFKVTIAIFAILLLGVIGGFVTAVGASDLYEDVAVIETENDTVYNFYPDGYRIGQGGELIEFTGTYILTGNADTNVSFTSNDGESVTYNVILYNWNAYAQLWHGLLGVDEGVTLNLTVHGENRIFGYNHAGISGETDVEDGVSTVNITICENSWLEIGYQDSNAEVNIHHSVNITVNPESTSSPDISVDGWRNERSVIFSRGNANNHTLGYSYVDESTCSLFCEDCQTKLAEAEHKIAESALDSSDENASTKHQTSCKNCGNDMGLVDHQLTCIYENEETHFMSCSECGFVTDYIEHNRSENGCTECGSTYIASVTVDEKETNYFIFENAVNDIKESGGTLKLLGNSTHENRIVISAQGGDVTVDLNGFWLTETAFTLSEPNYKITVIDSSEEKTGAFSNQTGGASACFEGVVEYNGITIYVEGISADRGTVIFNNVKVKGSSLEVYIQSSNATVEFTEVDAEAPVVVGLYMDDSYNGNAIFNSGEYQELEIMINADIYPGGIGVTFMDMLPQGKAFANEDGIVNANTIILNDVVIVEHLEHVFDEYSDIGYQHALACICGKTDDGNVPEAHTLGQDGLCSVCQQKIVAAVTQYDEGTTKYFLDIHQALENVQSLEKSKLTLYSDAETDYVYYIRENREITIDLNGYTLLVSEHLDVGYGTTLIIEDTSKEQNGAISGGRPNYSVLSVRGKLVFNSGRLLSIINAFGSEGEASEIIINGGTFEGITLIILYDYSNAVINGGTFKVDRIISIYDEPINSSVKIYGGIFETGLTINDDSNSLFIDDLLPQLDGCEITLVNKDGEPIELTENQASYNEYVRVKHENEAINTDGESHTFYCDTCSLTYASEKHRDYSYNLDKNNNDIHIAVCGVCEYELEGEEHSGGKATCIAQAICEYCEAEYGQIDDVNGHNGGEATCINKAVCTLCQKEYGNLNKNNHETAEYEYTQGENADEHNKVYACCGGIIDTGKHENGVADCTSKAVCTACGFEYGNAPSGHKYSNNCDASCNVCGEGRQINGHAYDNACDTECNECKATREITHTYGADGKCLTCDATTECQNEPSKNMGAGAIIGIILATVVVFGGGAFSLIWFVLRKKF